MKKDLTLGQRKLVSGLIAKEYRAWKKKARREPSPAERKQITAIGFAQARRKDKKIPRGNPGVERRPGAYKCPNCLHVTAEVVGMRPTDSGRPESLYSCLRCGWHGDIPKPTQISHGNPLVELGPLKALGPAAAVPMVNPVTPSQAKKIIQDELAKLGFPPLKLTARTIGFSDLARGSMVFVAVHGWKPDPRGESLKEVAKSNGFRVEFAGAGFVSNPTLAHSMIGAAAGTLLANALGNPGYKLTANDKFVIRNIVGRLHVSVPDEEVVKIVTGKIKGRPSDKAVKAAGQYAIQIHHADRNMYRSVMAGGQWGKNPSGLLSGIGKDGVKYVVKKDQDEWMVVAYVDGKRHEGKTYYAGDKADAVGTFRALVGTQENPAFPQWKIFSESTGEYLGTVSARTSPEAIRKYAFAGIKQTSRGGPLDVMLEKHGGLKAVRIMPPEYFARNPAQSARVGDEALPGFLYYGCVNSRSERTRQIIEIWKEFKVRYILEGPGTNMESPDADLYVHKADWVQALQLVKSVDAFLRREYGYGENPRQTKAERELDKAIEAAYYRHGNRVQIDMMSIPKIYRDVKAEMATGVDIDTAMVAAIRRYRTGGDEVTPNPRRRRTAMKSNGHLEGESCQMCGGPLMCLGILGSVEHYQCRNCGMQFSTPIQRNPLTPHERRILLEKSQAWEREQSATGHTGSRAYFRGRADESKDVADWGGVRENPLSTRLVRGDKLSPEARKEVLFKYIYRWTSDSPYRMGSYGTCPHCRVVGGKPGSKNTACRDRHPTIPLITDAQWLREHSFYIRSDGHLDERQHHAEPGIAAQPNPGKRGHEIHMTSSAAFYTPGILRWAIAGYRSEPERMIKLLVGGYKLSREVAIGLLSGKIPYKVVGEDVVFKTSWSPKGNPGSFMDELNTYGKGDPVDPRSQGMKFGEAWAKTHKTPAGQDAYSYAREIAHEVALKNQIWYADEEFAYEWDKGFAIGFSSAKEKRGGRTQKNPLLMTVMGANPGKTFKPMPGYRHLADVPADKAERCVEILDNHKIRAYTEYKSGRYVQVFVSSRNEAPARNILREYLGKLGRKKKNPTSAVAKVAAAKAKKNPGGRKSTMTLEQFAKKIKATRDPALWKSFQQKINEYKKWTHGSLPKKVTVESVNVPGVKGIWMTTDLGTVPETTYIMPGNSKRKGAWKHPWTKMPSLKGDGKAGIMITKLKSGNRLTDFLHG